MKDLHWLTKTWGTVYSICFEGGVICIEDIHHGFQNSHQELIQYPEALLLIYSNDSLEIQTGLDLIANNILDGESFSLIAGILLEGLIHQNLTLKEVIGVFYILDQREHEKRLTITDKLARVLEKENYSYKAFINRLSMMERDYSIETVGNIKNDVDLFLSGYAIVF